MVMYILDTIMSFLSSCQCESGLQDDFVTWHHVVARKLSAVAAARTSAQGCLQSLADNGDSNAAIADIRDSVVLVCHGLF